MSTRAQALNLVSPGSTRGVGWLARLPYPIRNAVGRWRSLLSMMLGVGIALSIGMTILAVISAESANPLACWGRPSTRSLSHAHSPLC